MELKAANNLIYNAKAMLLSYAKKLPAKAETDALVALLKGGDLKRLAGAAVKEKNEQCALFFRLLLSLNGTIKSFSVTSLTALHSFLFNGLKTDAGSYRTAAAALDGSSFTDPGFIQGSLKRLVTKLNTVSGAPAASKEDFALKITHYFSEMFLLCPFKSGSLMTQQLFFVHFARSKGFYLSYQKCGAANFSQAVKTSFLTDDLSDLYKRFNIIASYAKLTDEENAAIEKKVRRILRPVARSNKADKERNAVLSAASQDLKSKKADISKTQKVRRKPFAPGAAKENKRLPIISKLKASAKDAQTKTVFDGQSQTDFPASIEAELAAASALSIVPTAAPRTTTQTNTVRVPAAERQAVNDCDGSQALPSETESHETETGELQPKTGIGETLLNDIKHESAFLPEEPAEKPNLAELPVSVLKKAVKIKTKIEQLQKQLEKLFESGKK